jgi:hypothetical protein
LDICLNFVLQDIDISNDKTKSVILLIISLYCKTVWLNRNVKKFEKKNVNSNILYIFFFISIKIENFGRFWKATNNEIQWILVQQWFVL